MKNVLMGLALLATLSSAAYAGDEKKGKKVKEKAKSEAKAEAKSDKCEKAAGHGCCMKKTQA